MIGLLDYLQKTSSIDVLVEIYNRQGQPISEYANGGTNKTKMRRIREAASIKLVTISPGTQHNIKRIYLTERGTVLAALMIDLACAWSPHLEKRDD